MGACIERDLDTIQQERRFTVSKRLTAVAEADKLEGDRCDSEDETAVAADNEETSNEEESAGSDGEDVTAVAADNEATLIGSARQHRPSGGRQF